MLGTEPCCPNAHEEEADSQGLSDLTMVVQDTLMGLNLLENSGVMNPKNIPKIDSESVRRLFEGGISNASYSASGRQDNPIVIADSDSEASTPRNDHPITYSAFASSNRDTTLLEKSLVTLDIDSFLALPRTLAFAKAGLKVSISRCSTLFLDFKFLTFFVDLLLPTPYS